MSHKNIERLIVNYERRLQKLREQQSLEGRSIDPKILIEIEDLEAAIEELYAELEVLEEINVNREPLRTLNPGQRIQI